MKKYELNGFGKDWIFEGENEEECTKQLIKQCANADTMEQYEEYCEEIGIPCEINWVEVIDE